MGGAQHIAREFSPPLGVPGPDAHFVVRREASVAPGKHTDTEFLRQRLVLHQKIEHRAPEALGQKACRHPRQCDKATAGKKHAVGCEHVQMRIEVDQVAEGLHIA